MLLQEMLVCLKSHFCVTLEDNVRQDGVTVVVTTPEGNFEQ